MRRSTVLLLLLCGCAPQDEDGREGEELARVRALRSAELVERARREIEPDPGDRAAADAIQAAEHAIREAERAILSDLDRAERALLDRLRE